MIKWISASSFRLGSRNCFRDYDMSLEIVQTLGNLVVIDELAVDSKWVDIWRRANPLARETAQNGHARVSGRHQRQIDIGKELIDTDRALVDNSHASITIKEKLPGTGMGSHRSRSERWKRSRLRTVWEVVMSA